MQHIEFGKQQITKKVGALTLGVQVKYFCHCKSPPCFLGENGQGIQMQVKTLIWQRNKVDLLQFVIGWFEQVFHCDRHQVTIDGFYIL